MSELAALVDRTIVATCGVLADAAEGAGRAGWAVKWRALAAVAVRAARDGDHRTVAGIARSLKRHLDAAAPAQRRDDDYWRIGAEAERSAPAGEPPAPERTGVRIHYCETSETTRMLMCTRDLAVRDGDETVELRAGRSRVVPDWGPLRPLSDRELVRHFTVVPWPEHIAEALRDGRLLLRDVLSETGATVRPQPPLRS